MRFWKTSGFVCKPRVFEQTLEKNWFGIVRYVYIWPIWNCFSDFWFPAILLFSFSAFPCFVASRLFPAGMLFCVFLLLCFSAVLLLCFSASLNFFDFLLFCFFASLLLRFSLLFCFSSSASLLSAFPCCSAYLQLSFPLLFFCFSYCK